MATAVGCMRPRDSQRGRLYAAERAIEWDGHRLGSGSVQEVEAYVARVTRSAWWKKRARPLLRMYGVQVKDGRGCRRALAGPHTITIPRWARDKEWVILHELAHCLSWQDCAAANEPAHGRTFVRTYLGLVDRFIGRDAGTVMRETFREHGVKWMPARKLVT